MRITRLASIASGTALALLLAACGSTSKPVASAAPTTAPERWEYGRVTNIESTAGAAPRSAPSAPGVMLGAVTPGTTAMGAPGTTAMGAPGTVVPAASQVGRSAAALPQPHYRITVQTQGGAVRYYDVPATNDLKVGDRVQLQHDVIYR